MAENSHNDNPITPFAVTNYRDIRKAFGIKEKNRRGHMYAIGKTGTGKTTLLKNMIISDIKNGKGVAVIDPAGDLSLELLDYIPEERIRDVIYFNPADTEFPVGFNPVRETDSDRRHLVVSGIISVFKKIWPDSWGPRLEHILRNALLALMESPESTLLDIPPLLTDKFYREKMVEKVNNPAVREFWLNEFASYSAWMKSESTASVLNKVGQCLSVPMIRNILGQPENAFSFRQVMDSQKILIANLSKGLIGEDNASLLGSLLISQFHLAALARGNVPEKDRTYFYLYCDEIHSVATLSLADILSEARKFGLCLILAHQFTGQLDERIRRAIFGNVGTLMSFRVGQEDAALLAREFYPVFSESDLVALPNHHICIKMLIDGVTSPGFSAVTLPAPDVTRSLRLEVLQRSKEKYAKARKVVEQEIMKRKALMAKAGGKNMSPCSRIQKLPL